eukprot:403356017
MKQQTQRISNLKNKLKNSFEDRDIEKYLEQDSEVRIDWDDQENYDSQRFSKIQSNEGFTINQSQFASSSSRVIKNEDLESSGMPFQYIDKKNGLKRRAKNKSSIHDETSQSSLKLTKEKVMQICKQEIVRLYNDPFNNEDAVIQDSYVTFKFGRFVKQFFYHFLFFFFTGPLTGFILLPFENWNYLYNMGFLGFVSFSFLFQFFHWLFMMTSVILYFQFNQEGYMDAIQLQMLILVTLMRCLIVSIRYLYKIPKLYKERMQNYNYYETNNYHVKNEKKEVLQSVSQILKQDLKKTLRGSSKTNVIKTQPTQQSSNNDALSDYDRTFGENPGREDLYSYFSGRLIFRELILMSKNMAHRMKSWILFFISIVHASLPLIINMINDANNSDVPITQQPKYQSASFWGYFISCFLVNTLIYVVNLNFIEIGVIDMKRRKYNMKVLEIMLEPNRFKVLPKHRIFPLINYFDPQSLLSWMDIRIMLLDIGRRFYIRIEMYAFSYLVVYGLLGAIYLCWYFGMLIFEFSQSLIVIGAFEILNFLYFLYLMFHVGAINELSTKQILRITELRNVIERLDVGCEKVLQKNSKFANMFVNRTFKDALLYFGFIQEDYGEKKCKQIIEKTTSVLAIIQDRLEKEKEYNPIKIMGIPLNTTILYAIQSSLLTLTGAMINKKTGILTS